MTDWRAANHQETGSSDGTVLCHERRWIALQGNRQEAGAIETGQLGSLQVVVPKDDKLRQQIVQRVHQVTGHAGTAAAYFKALDHFNWPGMYEAFRQEMRACKQCPYFKPKPAVSAPLRHTTADYASQLVARTSCTWKRQKGTSTY